jgi:hypothetical protein
MKQVRLFAVACTLLLAGVSTSSYAQSHRNKMGSGESNPVQLGSFIVNLGIGAGADYGGYYYNTAFGFKIAAEAGLFQAGPGVITLGGELGGSVSDGGYYGYDGYKSHTFVVAGRAAWHYGWNLGGLDTYGGVSAGPGFRHRAYVDGNGVSVTDNTVVFAPGIFVGASYFFTPGFGVNVEAGYDITSVQAGVVFKM